MSGLHRGQMVIFARDGEEVSIRAPADATSPLDVLLLASVPLREPIAQYGPFVMNTSEEIYQAIEDYRSGKMGRINLSLSFFFRLSSLMSSIPVKC
jgi:quercetin 2,3-dioxygenase